LLPDLHGAGDGAERGLHLRGKRRPGQDEGDDANERDDESMAQLTELLAQVVAGGDPEDRRQPAEAQRVEPERGLVDGREQALARARS
jgi:hypothetical protein